MTECVEIRHSTRELDVNSKYRYFEYPFELNEPVLKSRISVVLSV
jgi:hypothetical protein